MGFMLLKNFSILFLLVSASFLSTSSAAGGRSKFVNQSAKEVDATPEEMTGKKPLNHKETARIHERLLKMNTKDYGRYDPAPAMVKPPFKLIPN